MLNPATAVRVECDRCGEELYVDSSDPLFFATFEYLCDDCMEEIENERNQNDK